jgi:hypothetical protein
MTKIKDFWEFHNADCWRIQRYTMVDFYLYLPTGRYIYKVSTSPETWRGTKNPHAAILLSEKARNKIKKFKTEEEAVEWLTGEKIKKEK